FSDNRRPDILVQMGERSILVDVTVKYPLAPTYLRNGMAQTSLDVAREGERVKNGHYAAEAKNMGMEFVPFSLEVLGGWGPAAQGLVKDLVDHASRHTHYTKAEALTRLVQGVSIALQRGNAYLLQTAYQRSAEQHHA